MHDTASSSSLAARLGRIGLGCATFGREIDEAAACAVMDQALARGITHLDTAASYGAGASERIVGAWLRSRRPNPRPLIATKIKPPYTPAAMSRALGESRARLGVETIDVLYVHEWSDELLQPASLATLDGFLRGGDARFIGASNCSRQQLGRGLELQRRHGFVQFAALQNNYNFAIRTLDPDLLALCARERIAAVGYSPLGAGFLTGKHRTGVEPGSRFAIVPGHQEVYFHPMAWERLAELESLAARVQQPLPLVALAWAFSQSGVTCTLIGGRSQRHVDQACRALALDPGAWWDQSPPG